MYIDSVPIRHFYYRGYIKSCNYTCNYCPFSKHTCSKRELLHDRKALERFTAFLCSYGKNLSVLITPYGEAFIHDYYWENLSTLTQSSHIEAAGFQSNVSFPLSMLDQFEKTGGQLKKLRLWCTFHPDMANTISFAEKCRELCSRGISLCTGAVGNPDNLKQIQRLRELLPEDIYLWINRMDGRKRRYQEDEIQAFTEIDPYFPQELSEPSSSIAQCYGGHEHVFVEGDGSFKACNISRSKLGNLYFNQTSLSKNNNIMQEIPSKENPSGCPKRCSCFLAYANRKDITGLPLFDIHPAFRIPIPDLWKPAGERSLKAIFFDIDGTLIKPDGTFRHSLISMLPSLASGTKLFFATSRPCTSARHKCSEFLSFFSGGVFADGSYVKASWKEKPSLHSFELEPELYLQIQSYAARHHFSVKIYEEHGRTYRILLLARRHQMTHVPESPAWQSNLPDSIVSNQFSYGISLVSKDAGKWKGIQCIMKQYHYAPSEIAYFGDSVTDIPALSECGCSVAMPESSRAVKDAAKFILPWT